MDRGGRLLGRLLVWRLFTVVILVATLVTNGAGVVAQAAAPAEPPSRAAPAGWAAGGPSRIPVPAAQGAAALPAQPFAGPYEHSLALDGDGDSVEVPHAAALNLNDGDGFTLEAWVKLDDTTDCHSIVDKAATLSSAYRLHICDGWVKSQGTFYGNTPIPVDTWSHIAVVWDRSTGVESTYINGVLDGTYSHGGPENVDPPLYIGSVWGSGLFLDGNLAEVRLWNTARDVDDIRRTLHTALETPRPGLVAVWHLSDDYTDAIGGHDGQPQGNAALAGPEAPPRPAVVPVDAFFNTLPFSRTEAASIYVHGYDLGVLIGGDEGAALSDQVGLVDLGSGRWTGVPLTLPSARRQARAAYVPALQTAYVFGGRDATDAPLADIVAVGFAPGDGVRELSATLPEPLSRVAAVHHDGLDQIYLFGGEDAFGPQDGIARFDPASETLTAPTLTLPTPRSAMAVAYAATTDRVYLFGGQTSLGLSDAIWEVALDAGGEPISVTAMSTQLPAPAADLRAVIDPDTDLIYLAGGGMDRVLAFDPVTGELWETRLRLPEPRTAPALFYSPVNRHAVLVGGTGDGVPQPNVWRIPLGDGPAIPLGHWDFPEPVGENVTAIDGDEDRVVIATSDRGLWVYNDALVRTQYITPNLGTRVVHDARYDATQGRIWVASEDSGQLIEDGNVTSYIGGPTYAVDFEPDEPQASLSYRFGTENGLKWRSTSGAHTSFTGMKVYDVELRAPGDLWVLTDDVNDDLELQHLTYTSAGPSGETSYGRPCYNVSVPGNPPLAPRDLAIGPSGNWWVAIANFPTLSGDTLPYPGGICYLYGDPTPTLENYFVPEGTNAYWAGADVQAVDVDGDGRLWFTLERFFSDYPADEADEGGLVAYQVVEGTGVADTLRTERYTWDEEPIAGKDYDPDSGDWDSSLGAVGAADERVWLHRQDGVLATWAQRWQQMDERGGLGDQAAFGVWTVRGRAFFAVSGGLRVLMPDGATWEHRDVQVNAVLGDAAGRIWLGTDMGLRLYEPDGWGTLDVPGTPPTGTIQALAQDAGGRLWIGSEMGLTLFDRERFVFTLDSTNSPLPSGDVRALLVDRDHRLWVGTTAGLARLDEGTWAVWTKADGLPRDIVYDLAEMSDGRVAVSAYEIFDPSVSFFDGSTFTPQDPPLSSSALLFAIPLAVDELGRLWAGSAVLNGDGWQGYYWTNSGLRGPVVTEVAADGAERVWFSHNLDEGVSVRGATLPPLADVQPVITGISPSSGSVGDTITINGSGFGDNANHVHASIGGAGVEVLSVSENFIDVRLTEHNHSGSVSVSVDGRRVSLSAPGDDPAFCAVPTITGFSPSGSNNGARLEIYGTNFDADAVVHLGGGPAHESEVARTSPTYFETHIEAGDGTGPVRVVNACAQATSATTFRHYEPDLSELELNQGLRIYPIVSGKPTLVRSYLSVDQALRPGDRLEIDEVEIAFRSGGEVVRYSVPYTRAIPVSVGPPTTTANIDDSLNVIITPWIEEIIQDDDTPLVDVTLKNNHREIADARLVQRDGVFFMPARPLRVLLVPIMRNTFTPTLLFSMTQGVNEDLANLEERLWPTGRVETMWSTVDYTVDEVLDLTPGESDEIDIGSFIQLYNASHELDRARRQWNNSRDDDALIAFGVIDSGAVTEDSIAGKAFWPDASELLNILALHEVDYLCDFGNAVVQVLTLGALGSDDGCHLEVPLYVAWAWDDGDSSQLFGHELGHTMGLVALQASNSALQVGSPDDNATHSENDELDNGERGDLVEGNATYNVDKTLYRQPGVWEPIVNPLNDWGEVQMTAQLNVTDTRNFSEPTRTITSEAWIDRAKALMAYPVNVDDDNVYFEPVDALKVYMEMSLASAKVFIHNLLDVVPVSAERTTAPVGPAAVPVPRVVTGTRLYVSGVVNRETLTGTLRRVEVLGEDAPLSPGFETGYWLVQRDEGGVELDRIGLYPSFRTVHSDHYENDLGFFAATILLEEGVARVELRHQDAVLDTFVAGGAAPTVSLSSPAGGGAYASGSVPVTWTASDADGDPLEIAVAYSIDDGAHWTPVAFAQGSGSVDLPVALLGGSDAARVRVTASDGFQSSSATSVAFSVAYQPPRPYVRAPKAGSTYLEGQRIILRGGADDNQDGKLAGASLRWRSARDGDLGTGSEQGVSLSVGTHTLTLEARNSAGLTATTQVTLTVLGDYDYDGIPDAEELGDGLNPLTEKDAFGDGDGDGLRLLVERRRGTDPGDPDTDGDGRQDGQEVQEGTDPMKVDAPLPPDTLEVAPSRLDFKADLALDVPLPQAPVEVLSRRPTTWTLRSDADWLAASAVLGQTPAGPTMLVDAFELADGVHTGVLTFTAEALGSVVTVPVAVTVTHSAVHFDVNDDGGVNIGDVQGVAGRVPGDNAQPGFDYHYDVDRDGDVDTDDTAWMAGRWASDHVCCPVTYPEGGGTVSHELPALPAVGERLTATARISGATGLGGFELAFEFDPTVLRVESASLGDFLASTGRTVSALDVITESAGTVVVGGYSIGSQAAATGGGTLATLTFEVLAAGEPDAALHDVLLAGADGAVTRPGVGGGDGGRALYLPVVLRDAP